MLPSSRGVLAETSPGRSRENATKLSGRPRVTLPGNGALRLRTGPALVFPSFDRFATEQGWARNRTCLVVCPLPRTRPHAGWQVGSILRASTSLNLAGVSDQAGVTPSEKGAL